VAESVSPKERHCRDGGLLVDNIKSLQNVNILETESSYCIVTKGITRSIVSATVDERDAAEQG
jgi:hypothetical protein